MEKKGFEPSRGRLFVAIELPDYVGEAVERLQTDAGAIDGVSWIPPEKLHLTLVFIGEINEERQEELAVRLKQVTVQPFFIELEGLEAFPSKGRPQVLWTGTASPDPRLFQLHGKVERITMDLGIEPERRRYRPHVTIARCSARAAHAAKAFVKKSAGFGAAPFRVDGITLFSSEAGRGAAVYRKLMTVRFQDSPPLPSS